MEWLDVYDENGIATGKTIERAQACALCDGGALGDGECYLGIHAYIRDTQGRYLIQRRALDKRFRPGGWDVVLGHVGAGETALEAMQREVAEEVGLQIGTDDILAHRRVLWPGRHHLSDIYLLQADFALEALVPQADEVIGLRLVDASEMRAMAQDMAAYRPGTYVDTVLAFLAQG